jgi:predicted tellurium resistance membrane protein TerC
VRLGLALVLCFSGIKMMLENVVKIPDSVALMVIVSTLVLTVMISLIKEQQKSKLKVADSR